MAEVTSTPSDREIELLELNHKGLHDSLWECHKVAWQVTSIFIPVLFAILGYLVKDYNTYSKFQVIMGFLVTEGLLLVWILIMRILEHYNNKRKERLEVIENRLNELVPHAGFKMDTLEFGQQPLKFRFSPMNIYYILLGVFTALNLAFLLYKLVA
jgi:hypothetical protein